MRLNRKELLKISKYILSSGTSFLIDLFLFTIFNYLLKNIFNGEAIILATVIARIMSSLYNYFMNSRFVFKSYSKSSIIKYYILVIVQMGFSAISVYLINRVLSNMNTTLLKFFVDIIIFVINYFVQRNLIFHNKCRGAYD